jgi:hypothetical protein
MAFQPTNEQQQAIDAFRTGKNMVLEAGAGTGKTSTLKLLAAAMPERKGLYLAFNKSVAVEAQSSFPANVTCSTVHSVAYRQVVDSVRRRRLNGNRQTGTEAARLLDIHGSFRVSDDMVLAPAQLVRIVLDTVGKFCHSADTEITRRHVPFQEWSAGHPEVHDRLVSETLPFARKAWADVTSPSGKLKYQHDHYVKEWALTNPRLKYDFIMVDEAQDSDPVLVGVVSKQTHAQIVAVGDRNQAIYGWRGAVDAMDAFGAEHHLFLTQSFRFGSSVASEANKWLSALDAELRITGLGGPDQVGPDDRPNAVLCRTNAGAIDQVMSFIADGKRPALVGGAEAMRKFAEAAADLQSGRSTWHPDLCVFRNWTQVQQYVKEDVNGGDLKVQVDLVDRHGTAAIIDACSATVPENRADVIVSTAHKAKGREWDRVRIHNDFPEPGEGKKISDAEAMLAYVAVTRAKKHLDNDGLSWIDEYLTGQPELATA